MSDNNNGTMTASGIVLYGTGLGVLTAYPWATGQYWSYLGERKSVSIADSLRFAITDAGMKREDMRIRAPALPTDSPYYSSNWIHAQGNAATVDAYNGIKTTYGYRVSDLEMGLSGKGFPQNVYTYANGETFRPDLTYKTFSPWSGSTAHFDETKAVALLTGSSKNITQVEQYGRAISEVNAASAGMRVLGTALRTGGLALGAAGFGIDVYNTSNNISAALNQNNTIGAGREAAQFGGRWGGTVAGTVIGSYGFAAGPIVGTATTIGMGIAGTFLGEQAVTATYDALLGTVGSATPANIVAQGFEAFGNSMPPADRFGQAFGAFEQPNASASMPSYVQNYSGFGNLNSYTPAPSALSGAGNVDTPSSDTGPLKITVYAGMSPGNSFDSNGFDFNDSYQPVVLDLTGNGINITQLSSSNVFFDIAGDGQQHLTAWAGTGNGVLFFDPTGQGQLTQANQVVFTDWDPSASSDMQALLDVFDTNHDGALDSGDTNFSNFFVLVTNADGTRTALKLTSPSLNITSINLNANAVNIALPDGSSIDGENTYTISGGATRTAATVTLASDPNGEIVTTTSTGNGDGSETIANIVENSDGSVAYQRILNTAITSSGGTTTTNRVLSELNAGGVVMTLQTDNIVVSGGTTTETLTNYAGGTIASNGELTSSGTVGAEKLNSTTTTTTVSSGATVVTILRDQRGGGWTTQREVDTTNPDGTASYIVSNVNSDGSVSNITTTSVTNGGLTRTVTSLVDGNSAFSTISTDTTVVNGGTRTETVVGSAGSTVTSQVQTITVTNSSSNSVTRTTTSDLTDGSTLNLTTVAQTVTSGGASTTTQTDTSADNALLDETITTVTPQSSGGLVTTTTTYELTGGAFVETDSSTTTISNAGSSQTTTVVDDSANGTLLSKSITSSTIGSAARTVTIYGNGDGQVTQSETVTVNSATTTDTVEDLNGDGSLISETVTTTANGGLAKTVQTDSTGAGTAVAPVFDHITTDMTTTSGGASTETVTDYGASTNNKIDVTQTFVSSNGLQKIVSEAFTGASLASGSWDRVTTDQTTVSSGGSVNESITVADGAGHVLETTQTTTSADRRTITTTTTQGDSNSNLVKQVETVTILSNGTVQDQVVSFDHQGDVTGATVTTTSADGLSTTAQNDIQGQLLAAYNSGGLAFDRITSATTAINADGSRQETTNVTAHNGATLSTTIVLTSPNGLSITTTANPYATAHYAAQTTDITTLNADGNTTRTMSDYNYAQALFDRTSTTTSRNGLTTTILRDFNGDGVTDQSSTDVITINADGTRTEVATDYTGGPTTGTVRDVTTTHSGIIVTSAGLETTIIRQSNGSVPVYESETIQPSANGAVTDTTQYYAQAGGPLLLMTTVITSANGLTRITATAVNGDATNDFWTTDSTIVNSDGSQTETIAKYNKVGLISETVTTTSANGLSKTTQVDANGALNVGAPVFNLTTTDVTTLNSDGSHTETITNTNANGQTIAQTVTATTIDGQVTINRYLDETGTITTPDQTETVQTQADGSVVDTTTSYGTPHTVVVGTIVKTTSGNGLSQSTQFNNGSTTVDTQSETTTYDANGDGGRRLDCEDTEHVNGTTLTASVIAQTSGNGQSKTITMGFLTNGVSNFNVATTDSVAIADTGVTIETIADTIGSASS
ncbi:MAG: hypothetical protein C5B46_02510, partial [Proteobacteria bacterium]